MIIRLKASLSLSHIIFLLLAIAGLLYPSRFNAALSQWTHFFTSNFGWLVMLLSTGFLLFAFFLACSRYGNIRMGADDETPEYSTLSWFSMLFAAGMGTGLVFHGVAEPLFHLAVPPPSGSTLSLPPALAARQAMTITYLHWGFHAWAIYAVAALAVAYFTFCHQQPMLASSPIQAHFRWKNHHPLMLLINLIAILAAVFGLVASIATGIHQLHRGIANYEWLSGDNMSEMLLILAALTSCYVFSSLSGLGKGIRWLSNINMIACITLMLFVLFTGPTHFIMQSFVATLGEYLSHFISLGLNPRPYIEGSDWSQDWTISYFLWWVAWAPFVAIFIARISRGRTIRQFLLGVIFIPTLFSGLWFSTLGGAALYQDLFQGQNLASVAKDDLASAMFALLEILPFEGVTTAITLFLIFIFLVTSADSGSYVLAMFSSEGNPKPARFQRVFWGVLIAAIVAITLISGEDVAFLRSISLAGAMPYMLIMVAQLTVLWRYLTRH